MSFIRSILFKWLDPFSGREREDPRKEEAGASPSRDSSSFEMAGTSREAIYKKLVAVANGDTEQVLPAIDAISRSHDVDEAHIFDRIKEVGDVRPYEAGHLFRRLFDRASINMRVNVIKEFVSSPVMGDKHMVGELFMSLMEHSTTDERRSEIYPGLLSIINDEPSDFPEATSKRAFLSALLAGWMSEI